MIVAVAYTPPKIFIRAAVPGVCQRCGFIGGGGAVWRSAFGCAVDFAFQPSVTQNRRTDIFSPLWFANLGNNAGQTAMEGRFSVATMLFVIPFADCPASRTWVRTPGRGGGNVLVYYAGLSWRVIAL